MPVCAVAYREMQPVPCNGARWAAIRSIKMFNEPRKIVIMLRTASIARWCFTVARVPGNNVGVGKKICSNTREREVLLYLDVQIFSHDRKIRRPGLV